VNVASKTENCFCYFTIFVIIAVFNYQKMKRDITSAADVELLISTFYSKVRQDDFIANHFSAVDWQHHTPVIVNFWRMILLGDQSYVGNPFAKHVHMKLEKRDFDRWLSLFTSTVDELFEGQKAEEAKQRAVSIAGIFQHKMRIT
jgi:hemoglobin